MKVPHVALALALALASTTAGPRAEADDATLVFIDKASGDRADDLSKRGLALASGEKKYAEAEALLREAWALKRSYDIAANLGIVDTKLEKWREAAELLTYAFRTFPGNGKPEHKRLIEATLAKAAQHVAAVKLTVRAKAAAPGDAPVEHAEVSVDGTSIGVTPVEMVFLDPGQHTLAAERPGVGAGSRVVDAQAGASMDVEVVLERPATGPVRSTLERRSPVPGIVLGSVGGAALVTGIGLLVGAGMKGSSARDLHDAILAAGHSCVTGAPNIDTRCSQASSAGALGDTLNRAGVGLLVGAGALAAGAAAYLLWPAPKTSTASARGVRLAPEVSTTTAGLVLSGSF